MVTVISCVIWAILAIGCFVLGAKGLSKSGIPLTRNRRIVGVWGTLLGIPCLLLGLASLGMALFLILDATGADPTGVDRTIAQSLAQVRTTATATDVTMAIRDAQLATKTDPPLQMRALVRWLGDYSPQFFKNRSVDPKAATIRDAWGKELRFVTREGHLILVSCGPNGVWEDGGGDDISGPKIELLHQTDTSD